MFSISASSPDPPLHGVERACLNAKSGTKPFKPTLSAVPFLGVRRG